MIALRVGLKYEHKKLYKLVKAHLYQGSVSWQAHSIPIREDHYTHMLKARDTYGSNFNHQKQIGVTCLIF